MSDASSGVIDKDAFIYTCKINEVEDPEAYLEFCLLKRIFIEADGGYTNSFVVKDQENYAKVIGKDQERKRKQSGKDLESTGKLDIDIDNDLDINKKEQLDPPQSIRPGPFKILRFDQIQWETLQMQQDPHELKRSIELAEAHIETFKTAEPQRYRELKAKAEQGQAYLMKWAKSAAFTQIQNEKAAEARAQKAAKPYEKPQAAPRPQPKEFKPPPRPPEPTPEQMARNRKLMKELFHKTTKAVAA
jgi:hypothetical protein